MCAASLKAAQTVHILFTGRYFKSRFIYSSRIKKIDNKRRRKENNLLYCLSLGNFVCQCRVLKHTNLLSN
jgi:hypothetical protein